MIFSWEKMKNRIPESTSEKIDCSSEEEVMKEIESMGNGKAVAENNIVVELMKYGGEKLH